MQELDLREHLGITEERDNELRKSEGRVITEAAVKSKLNVPAMLTYARKEVELLELSELEKSYYYYQLGRIIEGLAVKDKQEKS